MRTGQEQTTNDFRFTWYPDDGAAVVRQVVPKTYQGMGKHISNGFLNDKLWNGRGDALVRRETST